MQPTLLYIATIVRNLVDGRDHPLIVEKGKIAKQGIVVINNVTSMPSYGVSYVSPYFVISICHSGGVKSEYDGEKVDFKPHDLSVIYPNHTLVTDSVTDDYHATLVVLSERVFATMFATNVGANRFNYEQTPCVHLTDEQYEDVMKVVETIEIVCRLTEKNRVDLVVEMVEILMYVISRYRRQNRVVEKQHGTIHNLSAYFYDAVVNNYMKRRDIGFYADMFSLSPKYFNATIKKETGKSAHYWIKMHIVKQAKLMLLTDMEANIFEVSQQLGFPSQATFCHFFKREVGMSPSEYREKSKK